jgi:serine/threonine protein kinase
MNDIYNIKYKKYKKKYILLKQLIQEGGDLKLIGEGTFGCLISPPIEANTKYDFPSFSISDFSFGNFNTDKYVGKILAIKEQSNRGDSYENELKQLLKIKQLDPNGKYTPQLIYANVHSKEELLLLLDKTSEDKIKECINKKITINKFGYIISKNTGISLESKYEKLILTDKAEAEAKLINFLNNFNELLNFIKILYDKNYLHLDIKINNITVDENGKLYLIDFGRTIELKEDTDYDNTFRLLHHQDFMYSFEPKIYNNLKKKFKNKKISLHEIINNIQYSFKEYIVPYNYNDTAINPILKMILEKVFGFEVQKLQKEYFEDYVNNIFYKDKETYLDNNKNYFLDEYKDEYYKYYKKYLKDQSLIYDNNNIWEYKDNFFNEYKSKIINEEIEDLEEFWREYHEQTEKDGIQSWLDKIFCPIIKKFDMYCMGIVLAEIVFFKFDFDNLKKDFKDQFINLIKKLLFHKFDKVEDIISEINKLIKK